MLGQADPISLCHRFHFNLERANCLALQWPLPWLRLACLNLIFSKQCATYGKAGVFTAEPHPATGAPAVKDQVLNN